MSYCDSCGGIIGRDCFNPVECQWIADQMDREENESTLQVPVPSGTSKSPCASDSSRNKKVQLEN